MTFPQVVLPFLPPNTVVPEQESLFIPYLNRVYEDIAFAVNARDFIYYPMAITNTAQSIINMPTFGSFLICVSGATTGLPCTIAALSKAATGSAGTVVVLTSQAGSLAPWIGATLTITSTATNYQIAHSVAATTGNFNIRFIGTQ